MRLGRVGKSNFVQMSNCSLQQCLPSSLSSTFEQSSIQGILSIILLEGGRSNVVLMISNLLLKQSGLNQSDVITCSDAFSAKNPLLRWWWLFEADEEMLTWKWYMKLEPQICQSQLSASFNKLTLEQAFQCIHLKVKKSARVGMAFLRLGLSSQYRLDHSYPILTCMMIFFLKTPVNSGDSEKWLQLLSIKCFS